MIARIVGERLSKGWGQQVLIENRLGGGTNIANEMVVRSEPSEPDGDTVLMGGSSQAQPVASTGGRPPFSIGGVRFTAVSPRSAAPTCRQVAPPLLMTNARARMSAEIPARGPSYASHRRSSNANSLCGRNSAGSPKICATFQRDILRRHF